MANHTVGEPWQVRIKAHEAGLIVTNPSEGENPTKGLYFGVSLFGYMPEWEKFTTQNLPPTVALDMYEALKAWHGFRDHVDACDSCSCDAYCSEGSALWNTAGDTGDAAIAKAERGE